MNDDRGFNKNGVIIVLVAILAIFVIFQAGDHVADFINWITGLFGRADINPYNSRGFAAFVQLIALAVFIGWTYNRFKK